MLEIARDAAEKIIFWDGSLEKLLLLQAKLEYRYQKLLGGTILT